jgi:hypothetical protein
MLDMAVFFNPASSDYPMTEQETTGNLPVNELLGLMHRPLLIHIGYHKTATTWLQRALFTSERGYRPLITQEDVFELLILPHGLTFDGCYAKAHIAARRECEAGLNVDVISSEMLSGHPFYGGRESDLYARRLHEVAPDALILISIREQFSAMTSIYMQYLTRGGTMPPSRFFASEPVVGYFTFSPEHLQYHRLIGLYRDLFGAERVLVIAKETLDKSPADVIARIGAFCGNDTQQHLDAAATRREAASYPEYAASLLRRINQFRSGAVNPAPLLDLGAASKQLYRATGTLARTGFMETLCGRRKPVTSIVAERFQGRFAESNRALKKMLAAEIDLTGYEVDG